MRVLASCLEAFRTLLYPHGCMHCRRETGEGEFLCVDCRKQVRRIRHPRCSTCSQPFHGEIGSDFSCANCGDVGFHFENAISQVENRGIVRQLVHRFKYGGEFHLRRPLGEFLCECLDDERLRPFDAIVPVPLHPVRLREREFNQARALAEVLSVRCGSPVLDALARTRHTKSQTSFHRSQRMENLKGAFRCRDGSAVSGRRILLVDDVFTTGATVDNCARVLRRAGCTSIQVATAARS